MNPEPFSPMIHPNPRSSERASAAPSRKIAPSRVRRGAGRLLLPITVAGTLLLFPHPAPAALSEPDIVLYGSIVLSNQAVTAAQADVLVEARHTLGGPVIASYRMGSSRGLGSFYSLRLKVESPGALTDTNASQVGDTLIIQVRDNTGIRAQTNYNLLERGGIERFDFGTPVDDVEGNGIPDLWELAHLGAAGAAVLDTDNDGHSDAAEYNAGTDPLDPNDAFRIDIHRIGSQAKVHFLARLAQGPGYEGLSRFYSLQGASTFDAPAWDVVPEVTDVMGVGQEVAYFPATDAPIKFFRGLVSLGPTLPWAPDTNGLPDDWETAYLGGTTNDPNGDPDLDGHTTLHEFVSGTDPNNPNDAFRININEAGGISSISFTARKAEGPGYGSMSRHYTLERAGVADGTWTALPGLSDIVGNNQAVHFQTPVTNASSLYRARVELVSP